jgi:carbonic anhydrase
LIQKAWKNNKKVKLHGLVYRLKDGILHDLKVSMDSIDHVP